MPVTYERLTIERVVAGGDGLARQVGGRVVFVPGALPGEIVDVEVTSVKKDFARGRLLGVVEAARARVAAPCEALARGCGGCDWQHVDPAVQLDLKVDIVREALRRTGRLANAVVTAGGRVGPRAYRTSMRCAVDGEGRPGLRRVKSNEKVPLDDCLVAHPALAAMLRSLRIPGADEVSLRVSAATGEAAAWWTPEMATPVGLPARVRTGAAAAVTEQVDGVPLRVSASSFFQSGPEAAELLVATVRSLGGAELRAARSIVDAYGGVGLFAATVGDPSAAVVLVEGSPAACADARFNLRQRRARVVAGTVEAWEPEPADLVVADPARQGLGEAAGLVIAATGASVLVLISCDPASLARDARLLDRLGYRHTATTVVDLFPHTHHVEAVTRFDAG